MNQPEFIDKCLEHNWHYRQSGDTAEYTKAKKQEIDLISMVQRNPDLKDIFLIFQSGWFEKQDVA